jgi:hypothetical protein
LVFTVGKDDLTIATLLKRYAADIDGFGQTRTPSETLPGALSAFEFNLASLGRWSDELIEQARVLIDRLQSDANAGLKSEWKMISIFVGGINLCNACSPSIRASPEHHAASIDALLTYLSNNIPRDDQGRQYVYINMMTLFRTVSSIFDAGKDTFWCRQVQQVGDICGCLYKNDTTRDTMDRTAVLYNQALTDVVRKWQERTARDDSRFRVSLVRTMEEMEIDDLGLPYLSPTDWYFALITSVSFQLSSECVFSSLGGVQNVGIPDIG